MEESEFVQEKEMAQPQERPSLYDQEYDIPEQQLDTAIIFQLTAKDLLASIQRNLRGDRRDYSKNTWVPERDEKKRPMNDIGISRVMSELEARIGKNTFLSNLTDSDIEVICRDLHQNLTVLFVLNWMDFGMKKTDIRPLLYRIMDMVFIGMKRSLDKTTLNYLAKLLHISESSKPQEAQERRKFLGLF